MLKPVIQGPSGPVDAHQFLELCRKVRSTVPIDRYRHILGVARAAENLARRYGASSSKARVAALLHDVARHWTPQAMLEYAREHGFEVSAAEQRTPVLLHARIASDLAKSEFGIDDVDILHAIEHHTVAVPGMSDLEKILYIADSIEPSRRFPERPALELAAWRSLNEGMIASVAASLEYLARHGVAPAPETRALYDQLIKRHEART